MAPSDNHMEVPHELLTPYKLGRPVLTGSGIEGEFDEKAVDVAYVFEHRDRYYMVFVGFNGKGYQTGLARSRDLLSWEKVGVILRRGDGADWDRSNAAGTWILSENDLEAPRKLRKWNGHYWLGYHTYPGEGYEKGPARFGLAWTDDESLMTWNRLPEPILVPEDGAEWERGGLYKYCFLQHEDGFHMFYNAKNTDHPNPWVEQTGHATSTDLRTWKRSDLNPVLRVTPGAWDSKFRSDPFVVRYREQWVMFHFGFDGRHAQDGIAFSDDLYHWRQHPDPILNVGAEGEIDSIHAHKPSVIMRDGVLYHFYCACRPWTPGDPARNLGNEFRCISVATSQPVERR